MATVSRRHGVREAPISFVLPGLDRDSLNPTAEKSVLLFEPIERCVQARDNCLSLISEDDQFDINLFV